MEEQECVSMDIEEIRRVLPHRYPFLLVDRIIELVPGERAIGIKNVSINEPFFHGHYPQKPIMPGVLILEAMAQVGGIAMRDRVDGDSLVPLFAGIDKARFRRIVVPGDQLHMEVLVKRVKRATGRVSGRAFVDQEIVAEAELLFFFMSTEELLTGEAG